MTRSGSPFLHAYLLDRRGGGREVGAEEVAAAGSSDGVLWVHLDVNDPAARSWITDAASLDEITADNLLAGETRPRVLPTEDGVLVILRGVNTNPGANPEDMVSIRVWLEPERIITTRRRVLLSVQDMREAIGKKAGPRSSGAFLAQLAERLGERIGKVVDQLDESIDDIEAQIGVGDPNTLRSELSTLRRQIAAIRRYVAPQRDVLNRLPAIDGYWSREEKQELREESDRLTRTVEDLDLVRERVIVAQEELVNRLAMDQNARLYLLSIVAALFLPLTFITGLLGMNVAGLPGTKSPLGFTISLVVMGVTAAVLLVFFRWKKWI